MRMIQWCVGLIKFWRTVYCHGTWTTGKLQVRDWFPASHTNPGERKGVRSSPPQTWYSWNTCIHTYIHTHLHTYIHIHACMHAHIHTYIHTYIHIHLHTYIYMHACMHAYIHTYIHTYIGLHEPAHLVWDRHQRPPRMRRSEDNCWSSCCRTHPSLRHSSHQYHTRPLLDRHHWDIPPTSTIHGALRGWTRLEESAWIPKGNYLLNTYHCHFNLCYVCQPSLDIP